MEVEAPCGVPQLFKTDLWGSLSTGVDKLPQRSLYFPEVAPQETGKFRTMIII